MGVSNDPSTGGNGEESEKHVEGPIIPQLDSKETMIERVIPPTMNSSAIKTLPSNSEISNTGIPPNHYDDESLPVLGQKRCIEDVSTDQGSGSMNPSQEEVPTKKCAIRKSVEEQTLAGPDETRRITREDVSAGNNKIGNNNMGGVNLEFGSIDSVQPAEVYYDGDDGVEVEEFVTSNVENIRRNHDYGYYGPTDTTQMDGINDTIDDDSDNEVVVLTEDSENPLYTLPEGVMVEWNEDKTSATLFMSNGTSQLDHQANMGRFVAPTVCMVGRAEIRITHGSMEVLGHLMTPNSEPIIICSPYWSSWLTLTAVSMMPCRAILTTTVLEPGRSRRPTFRIVAPTRPIVIPPSWKTNVDDIVQECTSLGPTVSTSTLEDAAKFRASLEGEDDSDYVERDNARRHVCMITGAKGVGKSTLLRYMTNRLMGRGTATGDTGYQHVAILDADVGQPELAPPGLLRLSIVKRPLLHPPYWNLVGIDQVEENSENSDDDHQNVTTPNSISQGEVVSSIFFGSVTSKADPTRYITAIQFLMHEYQQKVVPVKNIPLLINMDGWIKGLGYQILSSLIQMLQPTHICQILGETRAQTFDIILPEPDENDTMSQTSKVYSLQACSTMPQASLCSIPSVTWRNFRWATYFLPPIQPQIRSGNGSNQSYHTQSRMMMHTLEGWNFLSAKDLQTGWIALCTSSSTRSKLDEKDDLVADECRLACALAREKPYCVPIEAVECTLIGSDAQALLSMRDRKERILQALNGGVVSLCTNVATNESLGFGILRSIDWERRLLYVLVPPTISVKSLTQTKALIGGNLPLPLPLLFRGVYSESFPYLNTLNQKKDGSGVENTTLGMDPMKSRNNIARRNTTNARG
jgi:hypothetical protein